MNSFKVHLQTNNHTYGLPKHIPIECKDTSVFNNSSLWILWPSGDYVPHVPKVPLYRIAHNPQVRDSHGYNIIDELAQSHTTMPSLKVLQTYPSQNDLILSLGAINPSYLHLMTFDLDKGEPS